MVHSEELRSPKQPEKSNLQPDSEPKLTVINGGHKEAEPVSAFELQFTAASARTSLETIKSLTSLDDASLPQIISTLNDLNTLAIQAEAAIHEAMQLSEMTAENRNVLLDLPADYSAAKHKITQFIRQKKVELFKKHGQTENFQTLDNIEKLIANDNYTEALNNLRVEEVRQELRQDINPQIEGRRDLFEMKQIDKYSNLLNFNESLDLLATLEARKKQALVQKEQATQTLSESNQQLMTEMSDRLKPGDISRIKFAIQQFSTEELTTIAQGTAKDINSEEWLYLADYVSGHLDEEGLDTLYSNLSDRLTPQQTQQFINMLTKVDEAHYGLTGVDTPEELTEIIQVITKFKNSELQKIASLATQYSTEELEAIQRGINFENNFEATKQKVLQQINDLLNRNKGADDNLLPEYRQYLEAVKTTIANGNYDKFYEDEKARTQAKKKGIETTTQETSRKKALLIRKFSDELDPQQWENLYLYLDQAHQLFTLHQLSEEAYDMMLGKFLSLIPQAIQYDDLLEKINRNVRSGKFDRDFARPGDEADINFKDLLAQEEQAYQNTQSESSSDLSKEKKLRQQAEKEKLMARQSLKVRHQKKKKKRGGFFRRG